MQTERQCFSCDRALRPTMSFPVRGVKKTFFCGDHFQVGHTFVCTPCAGQFTRLGRDRKASSAN